ncbi:MAG: hypothetical protein IKE58_01960 [Blautia sp.]|nr:hypothetical protein [Blautia sp.]
MRISKQLIMAFVLSLPLFCTSCTSSAESDIKGIVNSQLGMLKKPNAELFKKYLPEKGLYTDPTDQTANRQELASMLALYFQDFDYRIQMIQVSEDTASVKVKLWTRDAQHLAREYKSRLLSEQVLAASRQNPEAASFSFAQKQAVFSACLAEDVSPSVEISAVIKLVLKKGQWVIKKSHRLADKLIGGLVKYMSDPFLLSAEETLDIYLDTFSQMNPEELGCFMGSDSILSGEETADFPESTIYASALLTQIDQLFRYQIISSTVSGSEATVRAEIISADIQAIAEDFQSWLEDYLSSAQAVCDGPSGRYQTAKDKMLALIRGNQKVFSTVSDFHLVNDGRSWKWEDPMNSLAPALFGNK